MMTIVAMAATATRRGLTQRLLAGNAEVKRSCVALAAAALLSGVADASIESTAGDSGIASGVRNDTEHGAPHL